jgi:MFS family permease
MPGDRPAGRPDRTTARTFPQLALPRRAAFWLLAALLTLFLFAASAPSALYAAYQSRWGFPAVTLTAIYAVYALGALLALLVTGRLSDHVGRRPVTAIALLVQVVAMLSFIAAPAVELLFVARFLQGAATGMASGSISAWLLDLQPSDRPRLAAIVGGSALMAGLGLGALGAAVLVDTGPDPFHFVFWVLVAVFLAALALMPFIPDTAARARGWIGALAPRVGIPPAARALFLAAGPSLVAMWAVAGLFLALGPSVAGLLLHSTGHVPGALVITALLATSAVAGAFTHDAEPRSLLIAGSVVLAVGVLLTLGALASDSVLGLYVASVIAGIGFGPGFSGVFRSVIALAPEARRGELVAAVYIAIYVAFSVPAVLAGIAVGALGIRDTTYLYGIVAAVSALITALAVARSGRVRTATPM